MDTSKDIKVRNTTHRHKVMVGSIILDMEAQVVPEARVIRTVQVGQEALEVRMVPVVPEAQGVPMDQVDLVVREVLEAQEVPEAQEVQVALETQMILTVQADRVTLVRTITLLNTITHIIIHNNLIPTNCSPINYSSTLLCNSPILCVTQKIRP